MARTIEGMIAEVHRLRDEIEQTVVGGQVAELTRVFDRAELGLGAQRDLFRSLSTDADGKLRRSVRNIEAAERIMARAQRQVERWVVGPGQQWADRMVPIMARAGRTLARANLDVEFIPQAYIDAIFEHLPPAMPGVLRVGRTEAYTIMKTVGDDVQEWLRNQLLDGVVNGIPVQGPGDTLERRIFEGGRIRPLEIRTASGRLIRRSIRTRAAAIARVESAKIMNRVHEVLAQDALGDNAVYLNSNPQDSRTTTICDEASEQAPMSLDDWRNSQYGLPPRLYGPFHLCRSLLIGGEASWFEGAKGVPKPKRKAKAKPRPKRKVPVRPTPEVTPPGPSPAVVEAERRAAILADPKRPILERIDNYTAGDAKLAAIRARLNTSPARARYADAASRFDTVEDRLVQLKVERKKLEALHDGLPQGPERMAAWGRLRAIRRDEVDALDVRRRVRQEVLEARMDTADDVADVIQQEGSSWSQPAIGDVKPKNSSDWEVEQAAKRNAARATWRRAAAWVERVTTPRPDGKAMKFGMRATKSSSNAHNGWKYYLGADGKPRGRHTQKDVRINIAEDAEPRTWVHEAGHQLEYQGSGDFGVPSTAGAIADSPINALARKFRDERLELRGDGPLAGKKARPFQTFRRTPDSDPLENRGGENSFGDDDWQAGQAAFGEEHGYYRSVYAGKNYRFARNGVVMEDHTEIVSLGMDSLYQDALTFIDGDPQFAKFILGVLDGTFR